ncbi:MAG: methionyl-tRNA formyltransferase [Puniceicoccales bacterium]|jgi:methionyl-tRNA formyltransferase|nr:methionyl-tRNA formyltransferase [Puniceicoccales bacterium]
MERLVFLGTDGIGTGVLRWLRERSGERFQLVGAVSGVDRRSGRGLKLQTNPIAALCRELGLELLQTERPGEELLHWLKERRAQRGIVFSYGHILGQRLLDAVPGGFINLHASPLPELRGPSPIEGAIVERRAATAMTLMQLVREMDAGPTFASIPLPIATDETAATLRKKMAALGVEALERFLVPILSGQLLPREQDPSRATYTHILRREDGRLDFSLAAADLEARVRAFHPWPGSFFSHGGELIRVCRASVGDGTAAPGTILGIRDGFLEIATGCGILRCQELQRPTRKILPAAVVWQQLAAKAESRLQI